MRDENTDERPVCPRAFPCFCNVSRLHITTLWKEPINTFKIKPSGLLLNLALDRKPDKPDKMTLV